MILSYRTVESKWSILQLRVRQLEPLQDYHFVSSAISSQVTHVEHSGAALMPRQSLQSVSVHCGNGALWGVTHNILFLGGQQSGVQELVRCEGITLVPPGSRWLSLALRCGGLGHETIELQSNAASVQQRGLATGPYDKFLNVPLSRNDILRCKAFCDSLEAHQRGPVCRSDELVKELEVLFAPWLTSNANDASIAFSEGKLEDEFQRSQAKVLREDLQNSQKTTPKPKSSSAVFQSPLGAPDDDEPFVDGVDDSDESEEDWEALEQAVGFDPEQLTLPSAAAGGRAKDGKGEKMKKKRKKDNKEEGEDESAAEEVDVDEVRHFCESVVRDVLKGGEWSMGKVTSTLGRSKKGPAFTVAVQNCLMSDARIAQIRVSGMEKLVAARL